ncbi:MAG: hypothetical protein JNL36_09520 [Candidatus Kapabacteria bacterium]|nr:hypothetical protein [Candidatus Kapabacteria bacterium]
MEKEQSYEMCQIIDGYATDMFMFLDEDILGAETVARIKAMTDEEYEEYTKEWVRMRRKELEWRKKYDERNQITPEKSFNPYIKTPIILDDVVNPPKSNEE